MAQTSWSIVLGLILTAATAAQADSELRSQALPNGFKLDGNVGEWASAPTLELGPGSQVAGKSKASGAADISAKIWVAWTADGLVVAGDVVDDRVLWPGKADQVLASDHLELWLAFPPATLPPMGFANQFGLVRLEGNDPCSHAVDENGEAVEIEPEACREWLAAQQKRRRAIERLFARQYGLSPLGVAEWWNQPIGGTADSEEESAPALPNPCCEVSQSEFRATDAGYSFEVRLGLEDWPASARQELETVRFLVDLVDNDQGHQGQETFLSSAKGRRFGEAATFNLLRPSTPVRFETEPPFLSATLAENPHLFFLPAQPVRQFWGLKNIGIGYQYQPAEDSPSLYRLDVPDQMLAQFGDLELWFVPADLDSSGGWPVSRLVTRRRGQTLGQLLTDNFCPDGITTQQPKAEPVLGPNHLLRAAQGGEAGHLVVLTCDATLSRYGSGTCGACPSLEVEIIGLDPASGALRALRDLTFGSYGGGYNFELRLFGKGASGGFEVHGAEDILNACRSAGFSWKDLLEQFQRGAQTEEYFYSLDKDAPPDASPLFVAIWGDDAGETERLLAAGHSANEKDRLGHSALLIATSVASAEVIAALLEQGADPNFASQACGTENGLTPLMVAADRNERDLVERLLKAGARKDAQLGDGRKALDFAYEDEVKALLD